jgi:predicted nucleic acid-binding protein
MFDVVGLDDVDTAAEYGYLRASTEAVGQPISDNDLWIAASASANGLPLVTLNRRHFEPLTLFGVTLL